MKGHKLDTDISLFIVYFPEKSNAPCVLIHAGNKVIDFLEKCINVNSHNRCLAVKVVLQDKLSSLHLLLVIVGSPTGINW